MSGRLSISNDVILSRVCALLAEGKSVRLRAKGDSMRPFIRGDRDSLIFVNTDKIRCGDVVLARISDDEYVVHRVVGMDGEQLRLAGDHNLFRREVCHRVDVYGLVVGVVRDGQHISLTTFHAITLARAWRLLLPVRRAVWKLKMKSVSYEKE